MDYRFINWLLIDWGKTVLTVKRSCPGLLPDTKAIHILYADYMVIRRTGAMTAGPVTSQAEVFVIFVRPSVQYDECVHSLNFNEMLRGSIDFTLPSAYKRWQVNADAPVPCPVRA